MKGGWSVGLPVQCSWQVAKVLVSVSGSVMPVSAAPGSLGSRVSSSAPKAMAAGRRMKCQALASITSRARPLASVAGSAAAGSVIVTVVPCRLTQSFASPPSPLWVHSVSSSKAGSRSICCTSQSWPSGWAATSVGR